MTVTATQTSLNTFKASKELATNLQAALVDLIALELVGKQAHWNIVGQNFRDLHLNLDELVGVAREGSDEVAERMRALGATPDGRPSVVAALTTLSEFPQGEIDTHDAIREIAKAIAATVGTLRAVHDPVDREDPSSSGILETYTEALEKQSWFISAELREPANN